MTSPEYFSRLIDGQVRQKIVSTLREDGWYYTNTVPAYRFHGIQEGRIFRTVWDLEEVPRGVL